MLIICFIPAGRKQINARFHSYTMEIEDTYPLISAREFIDKFMHDPDTVVVDCRWDLNDREKGYSYYKMGHIIGAHFADMERDLSDMGRSRAGRHPMPSKDRFKSFAESIGISDNSKVVAYDDDGSGSSRLWFLLYYYGHDKSFILDGGISSYVSEGGIITTEVPKKRNGHFTPCERRYLIVQREDIRHSKLELVDARAPERFSGERETVDRLGGHIPGAINIPYSLFINNGKFRTREEVRSVLSSTRGQPVFYCGSGVTACIPFVASVMAGIKARIYPGSWSEWISFEDAAIESGRSESVKNGK